MGAILDKQRGQWAVRAATAVAFAVLILGVTVGTTSAKPYNAGNMSKGGFIAACEGVDGTITKKGTVLKCSFPNGASESCNFKNPKTVTCNYVPLVAGESIGSTDLSTSTEPTSGLHLSTSETSHAPSATDDDAR